MHIILTYIKMKWVYAYNEKKYLPMRSEKQQIFFKKKNHFILIFFRNVIFFN